MKRAPAVLLLMLGALGALIIWATPAAASTVAAPASPVALSLPGLGGGCDGPVPTMPSRGALGWITPKPNPVPATADPFAAGATTSVYQQYGIAPFRWTTCDLGTGPDIAANPGAVTGTAVADWFMMLPQFVIALYASLAFIALHPETWLPVIRPALTTAADALYHGLTVPLAVVVSAALGVIMVWKARRWSPAQSATAVGTFVALIVGMGIVLSNPYGIVEKGSTVAPAVVGAASNEINDRATGRGASDPATAMVGNVTDSILYQRWVSGMFGDATSPTAKKYGPPLFKASAMTWAEARHAQADPSGYGKKLIEAKQATYKSVMGKVKEEDPGAYEYATGREPTNRVGQALLALVATLCALPFLIAASIMLIAAPLMIAIGLILFLAGGIIAALPGSTTRFAIGPLTMAGAAVWNAALFGVCAVVQVLMATVILAPGSHINGVLGMVILAILTVAFWKATKPFRKIADLVGYRTKQGYGRGRDQLKRESKFARARGAAIRAGFTGYVAGRAAARAVENAQADDAPAAPVQPAEQPTPDFDDEATTGDWSWLRRPTTVEVRGEDAVPIPEQHADDTVEVDGYEVPKVPTRKALPGAYSGVVFDPTPAGASAAPAADASSGPTYAQRVDDDEGNVFVIYTPSGDVMPQPATSVARELPAGSRELPERQEGDQK